MLMLEVQDKAMEYKEDLTVVEQGVIIMVLVEKVSVVVEEVHLISGFMDLI